MTREINLGMPTVLKKQKKGLTSDKLAALERFIDDVHSGKIEPFKEKTEHARQNLKKAGLIK